MKKYLSVFLIILAVFIAGCGRTNTNTESNNTQDIDLSNTKEAIFAGGCFWCVESGFEEYTGVIDAISGFTGGSEKDAQYANVSSGKTKHYEAVKVIYDPQLITYQDLLEIYWRQFDPTDDGGSFVDRGTQYRSAIFYQSEKERVLAEQSKEKMAASGRFEKELYTPIVKAGPFYEAEAYHQNYHITHPENYHRYRNGSGRDQFIEATWGSDKIYIIPRQISEKDLKEMLTPEQFHITQEEGTEAPFKNEFYDSKAEGIYVDLISGEPLFSSKDKFDSGTGWPSFTKPIRPYTLEEESDLKLVYPRTELRSAISNAHLGHVFEDGPPPDHLRYCIDSAALRFVPKEDLEKEGYGEFVSMFTQ